MAKQMTVYIPSSGDSSSQAQSKVVTIPNLKTVDGLTVNTGSVNHTKSGNDVTINVSGGASVRSTSSTPSTNGTGSQTSGVNSFPATIQYNDGTYSGPIGKNGLSYVISGSYTPSDTKPVSDSRAGTGTWRWSHDGDAWRSDGMVSHNLPGSISYSSGGYVNSSLPRTGISGGPPSEPAPFTGSMGQTKTANASISGTYSGTATRPESDTRTWKQDYSGTVYGTTTTTYYYSYIVTLTYTDTVRLGTVNYKSPSGVISLPVYDLTMADPIFRIKLGSAIGCFELVSIGDARASNIRIQTQKGLKAIAKS